MVYLDIPMSMDWDKLEVGFFFVVTCSRDSQLSVTTIKKRLLAHLVLERWPSVVFGILLWSTVHLNGLSSNGLS